MTVNHSDAMKLPFLTPVMVTAFMLAAAPSSAATPNDPCATLPKPVVAAAIGAVVSVTPGAMGPSRTCTFHGPKPFRSVIVTAFRWPSKDEAVTAFHAMETQTSTMMSPTVNVGGLGDEAKSIGGNVYVRKGDSAYVFSLVDGTIGQARATHGIALARKAHLN